MALPGGRRYLRPARRGSRAAVRPGISAPIGNPDASVPPLSFPALKVPASERLCDAVVLAFALWTVCCHAVVAAGSGLLTLLLLFGVALAASLALWLMWRAVSPEPAVSELAAVADGPRPTSRILRIAALGAGVATALSFAVRPDVFQLWWSAVILLGLAAVALGRGEAGLISPPERSRWSEMSLWLLAAAAVVLTLISHRPDADDAFYVNVAVAAADVPRQALLSLDTMHGIPGLPLYLPVYRVGSYELLNGALSYLTGIPAIYSFHWLSAAFAALMVPLAHAKLLRILTPRRWLATVATLLFVLVAAGETHRWYGNFAFVRLWQGKAIFLSVFAPLVYAYALRFAARPNLRDWTMLGAAQIAAVGCSSSALWAAPVGAVIALICAVRPSSRGLKTVLLGTLASGYVLGAGWLVRSAVEGFWVTPAGAQEVAYSGPALQGALVTVLGDSRLLTFAIVALLTGWVFAPPGLGRRFAVIAPLAMLLGLLNPYIAGWVTANVTGPSYWRGMWALPLPILMALVLTSPLQLQDDPPWSGARRAAWLVLLAAFALLIPKYGGLGPENYVRLGWPTLKVPDADYHWATAVNERVPPGSAVAVASDIGTWIVTLHHRNAYPVSVRHYLRTWGPQLSREDLFERLALQRFVDEPELIAATPQRFRDGLDRFGVRAVCLVSSPTAAAARVVLREAGFVRAQHDDDYELWLRQERRRRGSTWWR